jgi:hypothetical protein
MQRGSLAMVSRNEAPSGTKTCPFGSSMVSVKSVQLFLE